MAEKLKMEKSILIQNRNATTPAVMSAVVSDGYMVKRKKQNSARVVDENYRVNL